MFKYKKVSKNVSCMEYLKEKLWVAWTVSQGETTRWLSPNHILLVLIEEVLDNKPDVSDRVNCLMGVNEILLLTIMAFNFIGSWWKSSWQKSPVIKFPGAKIPLIWGVCDS